MAVGSVAVACGLLVALVGVTKTGLVPQEDQGTLMINVGASPGSTVSSRSKAQSVCVWLAITRTT